MNTPPTVQAVLLVASGCAFCPQVHASLEALQQQGRLSALEVIDIAEQPERAQEYGVRSVPWFKLNELEFDGVYTPAELAQWVDIAASPAAVTEYLDHLLGDGQLNKAEHYLHRHPQHVLTLLPLITDEGRRINVRIGVGAVLEGLSENTDLSTLVEPLGRLTTHAQVSTRVDACHYLSLTRSVDAVAYLQAALKDNNAEVSATARDSLDELEGAEWPR
ncbi:thioredoxin family protein [Sulfuriflexus mobilis]|uniref:thioredoxin family protein n=1 Tax=Sulfuriflexus mobilis TaxID=1811807 RepID=UPI000F847476|nr:thioredoxin family protein [Sulfuriflexus mobilis]